MTLYENQRTFVCEQPYFLLRKRQPSRTFLIPSSFTAMRSWFTPSPTTPPSPPYYTRSHHNRAYRPIFMRISAIHNPYRDRRAVM